MVEKRGVGGVMKVDRLSFLGGAVD